MSDSRLHGLVCFGCVLCVCATSLHAATIFVDPTATGSDDGTSWADAFTSLHDALSSAAPGDQVWVVGGTYLPEEPEDSLFESNARARTFVLKEGIELSGGFSGTESALTQRPEIGTVETILSADLNDDDDQQIYSDNSYTVITVVENAQATTPALLDRVVVTAGRSNEPVLGPPEAEIGGAIFSYVSLVCVDCEFLENRAVGAGAVFVYAGEGISSVFERCVFEHNRADLNLGGQGGAVMASSCEVVDCDFIDNVAQFAGGAAVLSDCDISGCNFESNGTVETGSNSSGMAARGGALAVDSDCSIINCTFVGNATGNTTSTVHGTPNGGAVAWSGSDDEALVIEDCVFYQNASAELGGAIWLEEGGSTSIRIESCSFVENSATFVLGASTPNGEGGAIATIADTSQDIDVEVANCIFVGNEANVFAGAALVIDGVMQLTNCLFYDNEAPTGGAIGVKGPGANVDGSVEVINCTLSENSTSGSYGAGIYADEDATSVYIRNSIIWANDANGTDDTLNSQLYLESGPSLDIEYSLINGGGSLGVLEDDPRFVDSANDDYHLLRNTPARDKGDDSEVDWDYDLEGRNRIIGLHVDLGVYERCFVDYTEDGDIDVFDLLAWQSLFSAQDPEADLTGDGSFDVFDALAFQAIFSAGCD